MPALSGTSSNVAAVALSTPTARTDVSPVAVSPVDPQDHTRIDQYLDALGAPLRMGNDARNIAQALVSTMRALIAARPDLADAQFDFSSSNGTLVVSSATLRDRDRMWLQGQLNGNASLVQAVQAFHDDAVAGYAMWAQADGRALSPSELESVSRQADGLVSFMDLFGKLGVEAQKSLMTDGKYYTADGAALNLAQNPASATGFLSFMRSVDAAALGSSVFVTSSGHTLYGALRMDVFGMNSAVMPNFFPPSDTRSLGMDSTA